MLKDILAEDLAIVFCGTAKGKVSMQKGFYYAGPGNKFYTILYKTGLTPVRLAPSDCYDINQYSIGLTDLVQHTFGNDDALTSADFDVELFLQKMERYRPKVIAFNGKKGASYALGYDGKTSQLRYGLQQQTIANAKVYILPSTSGSASRFWDDNAWFELKEAVNKAP